MRSIVTALAVVLLAGCRVPIPEQENATPEPEGGVFNVIEPNMATPQASTAGPLGGRIPEPFLGRWGLVPADCTSTRGDNKGLMTVEADRLSFNESRATIAKLEAVSATELRATLAFNGEGQEWTEQTPLVLEDNGNVLTRLADGQTLRYTRCGA